MSCNCGKSTVKKTSTNQSVKKAHPPVMTKRPVIRKIARRPAR